MTRRRWLLDSLLVGIEREAVPGRPTDKTECEECEQLGLSLPPLIYSSDYCGTPPFLTTMGGQLYRWDPDGRVFVWVAPEERKGRFARFVAWIRRKGRRPA